MSGTPENDKPEPYPWALDEMAAAIAVFSHANVRSTRGGKALRESMSALLQPSDLTTQTLERLGIEVYEQDGSLKSLAAIVDQLERVNPPHADYWRIFGISAGATISQLVRYGSSTLRNLTAQVQVSEDAELLRSDTRELIGTPPRYNRLRQPPAEER
jgi:TP901 family phage tail tape measure protein